MNRGKGKIDFDVEAHMISDGATITSVLSFNFGVLFIFIRYGREHLSYFEFYYTFS